MENRAKYIHNYMYMIWIQIIYVKAVCASRNVLTYFEFFPIRWENP